MTPDDDAVRDLRARLLAWYDRERRDLPWRVAAGGTPDPYRVWLSEVMLQQTRVETVRPYFERWLTRFPTLEALADAPLDDVLKAWEGLGYYSRARNFHRAVKEVGERYGGEVPGEEAAFGALPGVGRYTAGAVLSIAFGRETPVVDGNVRRVFARLTDDPRPTGGALWTLAGRLVTGERPGDLNQALMELGAMVCTPRSPSCERCPLEDRCAARAAGTVGERPAPKARKPVPTEVHGVAVLTRGDRVLLARRPLAGRLAGMWEFPGAERREGEGSEAAAARAALAAAGVQVETGALRFAVRVEHAFTHVRVVYEAFAAEGEGEVPAEMAGDAAWVRAGEVGGYALPRAQQRIARAVL